MGAGSTSSSRSADVGCCSRWQTYNGTLTHCNALASTPTDTGTHTSTPTNTYTSTPQCTGKHTNTHWHAHQHTHDHTVLLAEKDYTADGQH